MQTNSLNIVVLVSGNGSNLQALIDKKLNGELNIQIIGVISNKKDAYALTRAKNANIPTFVISQKTYQRAKFEQQALAILNELKPDLVVLAGFMKILTPLFINGVKERIGCAIINLHPSLLPAYKGLDTHRRVLQAGEKLHGCTVHLVTAELDAGQILTQAVLHVSPNDTPMSLQEKVHTLEHMLLPRTIDFIVRGLIDVQKVKQTYRFLF